MIRDDDVPTSLCGLLHAVRRRNKLSRTPVAQTLQTSVSRVMNWENHGGSLEAIKRAGIIINDVPDAYKMNEEERAMFFRFVEQESPVEHDPSIAERLLSQLIRLSPQDFWWVVESATSHPRFKKKMEAPHD